mgnify:CR=1 FL=1
MATPNKTGSISSFKPKSFLLTTLVVLLVASLFFIPEIVDFQKSITGFGVTKEGESKPEVASERDTAEHTLSTKTGSGSPLDKITGLIDTGYIEQLKAKKVVSGAERFKEAPRGGPKLSWEIIKSRESLDALRTAEREALGLAKALPPDKVGTRYALYNFVSGVRLVLEGAEKTMSPDEAVRYLEFLQLAVSSTMGRENVDRALYNRWVGVSLGPLSEQTKALRLMQQRAPFNPRLTLTKVVVRKAGGKHGQFVSRSPVYVQFVGFVVGQDIKKIELYRNSELLVKKMLLRAPDESGRRFFSPRQFPAVGYYTFRVYDDTGQIYQKTYTFFPRAARFPWRRGVFELPFRSGDPRLDRFFTYRSGRLVTGGPASGFLEENQLVKF